MGCPGRTIGLVGKSNFIEMKGGQKEPLGSRETDQHMKRYGNMIHMLQPGFINNSFMGWRPNYPRGG